MGVLHILGKILTFYEVIINRFKSAPPSYFENSSILPRECEAYNYHPPHERLVAGERSKLDLGKWRCEAKCDERLLLGDGRVTET